MANHPNRRKLPRSSDALRVEKVDSAYILLDARDVDRPYPAVGSRRYKAQPGHCLRDLAIAIVENVLGEDCRVDRETVTGVSVVHDPSPWYGHPVLAEYRILVNRHLSADTIRKYGFTPVDSKTE